MSVYVFLGPSLARPDAEAILDAEYLPPIKAGDLCELMARAPRVIGIIDGLFEQVPAVWHKEILFAMSKGVRVYGGGSLGALRAAELHDFGMIGVGRIFEDLRDGVLEDDDEVALLHGPAERGFPGFSAPMVNLRDGLRRAAAEGLLAPGSCEQLIGATKARFYPDRSWESVFADGKALGLPEGELRALRSFVERVRPNLKRDDALRVVSRIASDLATDAPAPEVGFELEPSGPWMELQRRSRVARRKRLAAALEARAPSPDDASPMAASPATELRSRLLALAIEHRDRHGLGHRATEASRSAARERLHHLRVDLPEDLFADLVELDVDLGTLARGGGDALEDLRILARALG